mmetsp:Transcript_32102/g.43966  ORF Transcript_32102/g.43966 Transcript_32102/m.43966 type:complete len:691 (+) Transcript_32102:91-2163(+)
MADESTLVFQPFSSYVDVSFWSDFSKKKLEIFKLSEDAIPIHGSYSCGQTKHKNLPSRLLLSSESFQQDRPQEARLVLVPGELHNSNTIEGFKKMDKKAHFDATAKKLWESITSGDALANPSQLGRFVLFTFADLKKYKFSYLFAFPAIKCWGKDSPTCSKTSSIDSVFSESQISAFRTAVFTEIEKVCPEGEELKPAVPSGFNSAFFLASMKGEDVALFPLTQLEDWLACPEEERIAVFSDPGTLSSNPGWPLRNFLALLHYQSNKLGQTLKKLRIVCLRHLYPSPSIEASIIIDARLPANIQGEADPAEATGWEKNPKGKVAARQISLADSMDPVHLTETAVGLNLKLMRWRIMPTLDLDKVGALKCLIIGSGTLGCNVGRSLLGWGVKHITFVDNGRVSLSNPVRQSLFTFEDSRESRFKAEAAADQLKKIFPSVNSQGHVISIPMPGHSVSPQQAPKVEKDVQLLRELYAQHDAVFLLTDSRESRWLPTLLGADLDKIVLNAAMGFDTFLCMRHGGGFSDEAAEPPKDRLGCYFCNDVVAPKDSLTDRTLDQQCTVTRPGLSYIVSALAAELLVSLSQHPLVQRAPADTKVELHERTSVPLGIIPHQIRGYLSHFQNLVVVGYAYEKCTACSLTILKEYRKRGFEFLLDVFNRPGLLEDLAGLSEMHQQEVDFSWDDDLLLSDEEK